MLLISCQTWAGFLLRIGVMVAGCKGSIGLGKVTYWARAHGALLGASFPPALALWRVHSH